ADDETIDAFVQALGFAVDPFSVHLERDLGKVGRAEHSLGRKDAEERDAETLEHFTRVFGDHRDFVVLDFVENRADDLNALFVEKGFVESDFIDWAADSALGDDDDLGVEEAGDAGIGKIENGADAGVAGAFDEGEVLFPGNAVEGAADFVDEAVEHSGRIFEITAGEGGIDGDRAHLSDRDADIVNRVEEVGILVDLVAFDLDETLADRFDETDIAVEGFEGGVEAEASGGFAVVLPGGGDEDAPGLVVGRLFQERFPGAPFFIRGSHFRDYP